MVPRNGSLSITNLDLYVSQKVNPPKKQSTSLPSGNSPVGEAGEVVEELLAAGHVITYGHEIGTDPSMVSRIYFERVVDSQRHIYATNSQFWA